MDCDCGFCPHCGEEVLQHTGYHENIEDAHNTSTVLYMCGTIVETDITVAKGEDC